MFYAQKKCTRGLFIVYSIIICIAILASCANPSSSSGDTATTIPLSLGQFPSDKLNYRMYAEFWNGSTYISQTDLGLSSTAGLTISNFALPAGTTKFGIYLFDPQALNSDPLYFDFYTVKSSDTSYESYYWLDYHGYFHISPRKIRYGISEQAVTSISNLSDLNLDFRKAPYFLFKYENLGGSLLNASYSSVGDGIWVNFESSVEKVITTQKSTWPSSYSKNGKLTSSTTPIYLIVQPSEFSIATTATISFSETGRLTIEDTINCLVPTEKANVVYAVTTNSHSLYKIDPIAKTATLIYQLPLQNIDKVVYSDTDKKLYGYTSNSGTLFIFDIVSGTCQTVVYATATTGQGIDISPEERRIYLCAGNTLYIVDQDNLNVISSAALSYTHGDISYSLSEKAILYSGTYEIKKYSVANDKIVNSGLSYSSTEYYGNNGFVINHTGSQLVYANIGTGYFVRTISTDTMQVNSTWNIGAYPRISIYSSDDSYIYASIGDGNVYRSSTNDFSQVSSYVFPPTYFVVNSDNTRLVGFSSSEKCFYFLDVSKNSSASSQSSGSFSILKTKEMNDLRSGMEFLPKQCR